jgi:hypothetical protein
MNDQLAPLNRRITMAKSTNSSKPTELTLEEKYLNAAKFGARAQDYRTEYVDVSQLWEAFLSIRTGYEINLESSDVAKMMMLMNLACSQSGPSDVDLLVRCVRVLVLQDSEL